MRRALPVVALALTSCTVGPDYRRPEIAVSSAWRNAPTGDVSRSEWWLAFGDPVLDRLEIEALGANLDLEQALARIDQARGGLRGADAALLPVGEIDANAARVQQSLNSGLGQLARYVPGLGRTVDSFQLSVGGSWEIDFAGGLRREREAERAHVGASEAELAATRLAVSGELADAFWALRGAQAQAASLAQLIALADDQRGIMAARVRFKAAPKDDLRKAEAAVRDLEAQAPALTALAEAEGNRIAVLLGRDPSVPLPDLEAVASVPEIADPAVGQPGDVLRNRADVRAAEQRLIASNAGIGAALAEYYPKITLSGLIGQVTNQLASLGSRESTAAQGALSLRWRLFDFGRVDAEVRIARGREREARAAYRQTVLLAAEDVETSFAQLAAARSRLDRMVAKRVSLAAAAMSADRAFRVGEISRDDMLTAEFAVTRVDIEIAGARRDFARSAVACYRAIGGPTDSIPEGTGS